MAMASHHRTEPATGRATGPTRPGFFGGAHADAHIVLSILAGLAAIAIAVGVFAAAGIGFGVGPRMEPVAYLLIAVSAAMLLFTYLITFIESELRAALYMVSFWGITIPGVYIQYYVIG